MQQDKKLTESEVIDGLNKLGARAAELGLLPENGANISARGKFIVAESNVEESENKKQRGYRYKPFPKAVHAWNDETNEPLMLVVNNPAELEKALAVGWSIESVHGPAGRLVGGVAVDAPEEVPEVREILAPGAVAATAAPAKASKAPKAAKKK